MAQNQFTKLKVWGATDRGRTRPVNEDYVFPHSSNRTTRLSVKQEKGDLLLVADGVGGGQAGRTASKFGAEVAIEGYDDGQSPHPGENLRTAIETANSAVYQFIQSRPSLRDAGSTLVAAVAHQGQLHVANVGDSRAYLIRGGQATQLTRDHTLTQQKIDLGRLTPEQAADDPDSHIITRSLGAGPQVQVDLFPPLPLQPGDVVLLCSDGLSNVVSGDEIARIAGKHPPQKASRDLIKLANKRGGPDNISLVIGRAPGGPAPVASAPDRQRAIILAAGAVFFSLLCIISAVGFFSLREENKPTPTLAAPIILPTEAATASSAPIATAPESVEPTPTWPPNAPAQTSGATSTAVPTYTPTNTPTATRRPPPTYTYTPTATPSPLPTTPAETQPLPTQPSSTTGPGPQPATQIPTTQPPTQEPTKPVPTLPLTTTSP